MIRYSEELDKYRNSPKRRALRTKQNAIYGPFRVPITISFENEKNGDTYSEKEDNLKELYKKYSKSDVKKAVKDTTYVDDFDGWNRINSRFALGDYVIVDLDLDHSELVVKCSADFFVSHNYSKMNISKPLDEKDVCDAFDNVNLEDYFTGKLHYTVKIGSDKFTVSIDRNGPTYPDPSFKKPDAELLNQIADGINTEEEEYWDDPGYDYFEPRYVDGRRDYPGRSDEEYAQRHAKRHAMYKPAQDDEDTYNYHPFSGIKHESRARVRGRLHESDDRYGPYFRRVNFKGEATGDNDFYEDYLSWDGLKSYDCDMKKIKNLLIERVEDALSEGFDDYEVDFNPETSEIEVYFPHYKGIDPIESLFNEVTDDADYEPLGEMDVVDEHNDKYHILVKFAWGGMGFADKSTFTPFSESRMRRARRMRRY